MGTGRPFSGVKRGWGVTLTTHPYLVPRVRMSRSYSSSPPSASMACNGTALLYLLHLVGSTGGLILSYYPGIRMERLRKTTKTSVRIGGSRGRESNPGPPEYKVGLLTTELRDCLWEKRVTQRITFPCRTPKCEVSDRNDNREQECFIS
jgi:hypothetical protein